MKKHILSLTLGSLLVSALSAEDDGFYTSVGYQIGEATQMVKNTKGIQELSDNYEKLNNLLTRYSTLNTLIKLSADPSAVSGAINNLNAGATGLLKEKTNSPAYQAVSLALNAAVGLWNTIGYAIMCGNGNGTGSGPGSVVFNGQPGQNSTSITCNRYEATGPGKSMSIDEFKKLNEAYQIIQQALKSQNEFPELGSNGTSVEVNYEYECKQGNGIYGGINGGVNQFCEAKNGTSTQTTNQDGVTITTTYGNNKATVKFNITNNAQELLNQAANIMQVLNTQCPLVRSTSNEDAAGNGSPWGLSTSGDACTIFQQEFSQVTSMIKNAQEIVAQSKIANANQKAEIKNPNNFNPFTDASFAQGMLANAKAQTEILTLAEQVKQNLEVMENNNNVNEKLAGFGEGMTNFVSAFLASCKSDGTLPNAGVTNNTWGAGCAYVQETITALNNSIAHFGTQAEQIQQAENIADTLVHFKSRYNELGNTYNSITTALSNIPNAQSLQNAVSKKNNPYSPQGIETNYYLNQNSYNQIQTINQELGRNPFRKLGIVSSQTNNGAMNGIGIQVGYKQFFGQKRKWGARYYGFFDYNHAFIKSSFFNSASDVWTYGFGADALYNFINDKATNFLGKNNKLSVGLFGGIALAGTSWLNSEYVNLATMNNVYNAKMNVANFQFLFNMGVRMNLARPKKKDSDHAAQHGIELGLKIPTINTNYYSFMGAELKYRRLYSVYLNYVFAY
ncbi:SabA family sialic acid-binding adhesin [Helicobacter pylori]|uniref:Hop family adhesin SabA n=1 Tax=Helicobacter pylori TaxID=210 RepID=UPI0019318855|nr:SabA family sialic acid-binding adhesin [Helicobacter pylori]MBM0604510.1 outer membrane beta-barrel protein [Helicobacter pylori]MBM0614975.1 outer membrane beta-barrel protein [Helicobacter pylori]MBM0616409.1 outer membrane beta-barrel protein [Helicobacter pylori]MBM0617519.1 outer membrane beta-barrel protein [Helicobacter pylori]MBM0629586.1 outer membrane beta-barrel protein [Helicobacter pylori]